MSCKKTLTIMFFLTIMTIFVGNAAADVVTDGLVSYWPMDADTVDLGAGTVTDVVGGLNGDIQGAPVLDTGVVGEGIRLAGWSSGDFVQVGDGGDPELTPQALQVTNFTVEVRCYADRDAVAVGGEAEMLLNIDNGQRVQLCWHMAPDYNKALTFNPSWIPTQIPDSLVANTWYHIAASYDGSYQRIYLNGLLADEDETVVAPAPAVDMDQRLLTIGNMGVGSPHQFGGILDEVRVYNRALTDAEIGQNYEAIAAAVSPLGNLSSTWGNLKSQQLNFYSYCICNNMQ